MNKRGFIKRIEKCRKDTTTISALPRPYITDRYQKTGQRVYKTSTIPSFHPEHAVLYALATFAAALGLVTSVCINISKCPW